MSRMKLWWFVGFLAIVLRANAVFSLPQVAVIGPQAGSEECRRAQASWHESFGCVCEEYPTVDSALAADRRPRMYVFWKGDSTPTPADGEKFRAAVVRVRQADAYANVTLIARDAAWRKAAEGLSVTVIDVEGTRLVTTYLREVYERGWGVDWSVVKKREKRMARRTQRLHDAKWGVFNHFLGHECKTAAEWNAKVAGFDVKRVADQLEACGAGFYFLTVMQGDRWMCAPSATYDSIAGTKPGEACSVRDLPLELADELGKRGIDLYLYFTGDGPWKDPEIGPRFGLSEVRHLGVTESFVDKWSSVLGELSKRYGDKVKGWWIDGCYDDMLGYTDKLLARYGAAVRAGNPAALVAMNNGVFPYFKRHWADEDFTAGEFNDFYCVPEKRFVDGAQAFVLAPLGAWRGDYCAWSSPGCKRSAEYVANYVRLVNANGGVVCIDVKVHEDGSWDSDQMEVLKAVGRATGTEHASSGGKPVTVAVDFADERGPVKPVNGVGQPPILGLDGTNMFHYLREAGIPYSRLHDVGGYFGGNVFVDIPNLFRDFEADETRAENYDFHYTDLLLKALVENGVEPYFRLGVTIENAAGRGHKAYRIFPPKDFAKWARICEHVIRHYTEGWADGFRMKISHWEIWNEPENVEPIEENPMWKAPFEEYIRLYLTVAPYLKEKFPHLKIGGYGGCGFYVVATSWPLPEAASRQAYLMKSFTDFLAAVRAAKAPLDFFSFHCYDRPAFAGKQIAYCRKTLDEYGFKTTEMSLNEWLPCDGAGDASELDTPLQAAQVAAMLTLMQNGPVDDAEIYDARAVGGAYAPLFAPETHRPRKAYRVYCAFNELRKLGTAIAPPPLPDGLWACGATDGKGRAALLVANTSDAAVALDFRTPGWRMESVRDVLSEEDAVARVPLQIQPNGVRLVRFGLPQKAISNTERNANN